MWKRTLHLEEMLLLPKSPLLFLVCSFLSCFVSRDPHGRQRGRLQARTDAPSVEDARCRTRKLGFPGSCFEGGGCRKHGFPVSCGFRETSMAYAGQEQRGAVMSLAEAGGAPTTRGVLIRISSSHGSTMLSSFPVEGEALLLVRDVSFQEVLGSRHRQGYVTVDCFDIRVLETLKVGVLRYSGIFLASTSSWVVMLPGCATCDLASPRVLANIPSTFLDDPVDTPEDAVVEYCSSPSTFRVLSPVSWLAQRANGRTCAQSCRPHCRPL